VGHNGFMEYHYGPLRSLVLNKIVLQAYHTIFAPAANVVTFANLCNYGS
jgi:hypothetical protein